MCGCDCVTVCPYCRAVGGDLLPHRSAALCVVAVIFHSFILYKCLAWSVTSPPALGQGLPTTGGKPSTADGWRVALGGTEESLRHSVLGVCARGAPADYTREWRTPRAPPLTPWHGWVDAHDGDYSDAVAKGYGVTLMATETSGAVSATVDALFRRYDRISREPGTADYTVRLN